MLSFWPFLWDASFVMGFVSEWGRLQSQVCPLNYWEHLLSLLLGIQMGEWMGCCPVMWVATDILLGV